MEEATNLCVTVYKDKVGDWGPKSSPSHIRAIQSASHTDKRASQGICEPPKQILFVGHQTVPGNQKAIRV